MSDMRDLRCPYCDGALTVHTETAGPPYLSYETPESIECVNTGCNADWEPDGTARSAADWIRFPTLYAEPATSLRPVDSGGRRRETTSEGDGRG